MVGQRRGGAGEHLPPATPSCRLLSLCPPLGICPFARPQNPRFHRLPRISRPQRADLRHLSQSDPHPLPRAALPFRLCICISSADAVPSICHRHQQTSRHLQAYRCSHWPLPDRLYPVKTKSRMTTGPRRSIPNQRLASPAPPRSSLPASNIASLFYALPLPLPPRPNAFVPSHLPPSN